MLDNTHLNVRFNAGFLASSFRLMFGTVSNVRFYAWLCVAHFVLFCFWLLILHECQTLSQFFLFSKLPQKCAEVSLFNVNCSYVFSLKTCEIVVKRQKKSEKIKQGEKR